MIREIKIMISLKNNVKYTNIVNAFKGKNQTYRINVSTIKNTTSKCSTVKNDDRKIDLK